MGMVVIALVRKVKKSELEEEKITRADLPYTLAMIVLDIAAPIFLLLGLLHTTAANASLLNNFEIVATAVIALMIFKERISPRLWFGILFVTASCLLLSTGRVLFLRLCCGCLQTKSKKSKTFIPLFSFLPLPLSVWYSQWADN